jgi:hypothetical protein
MSEPNKRMQYPTDAGPALGAVAITGAAQTLATRGRGLHITVAGNITFTMEDGTSMTHTATSLPIGFYPFTVRSIDNGATAQGYVLL